MTDEPEFSFEIDLTDFGKGAKSYRLVANEEERRQIAVRLKTPSVERLEGALQVSVTKASIHVKGDLAADLTRECVASLEPVAENISETLSIDFSRLPAEGESGDSDENWDAPEIHEGDQFDLGELLVQQLSLAMEPFPRREGAPGLIETYAPSKAASPFADLKGFLGKTDDNQ